MKRSAFYIGLAFLLLVVSCGKKPHETQQYVVNMDSLFINLDEPKVAQRTDEVSTFFNGLAKSGFNGVVLYAEQGRVVYENAYGYRKLTGRHRDSLRVDDAFQLSSDSKMFTAEAVMMLYAQGKLDYDDDVRKYIPELPYEGITIRNLLNHRSGLPRYDSMSDEFWPDRTKPFSNEEMIKMLADRKPERYAAPDVTYFYNNINYALLASVVERVSGQHFEDFMHDNIFEPLGMDHSYIFSMRDDTAVSLYMNTPVQGHTMYRRGPEVMQNDYLNGVMGDKIMFSTVDDLHKYLDALDNNMLLPDSIQSVAFVPGSKAWKHDENYGFGWRMSKNHPDVYYHYGWWKGYRSAIIRDVALNRQLILLTNTTQNISGEMLWAFLDDTTHQLPAVSFTTSLNPTP